LNDLASCHVLCKKKIVWLKPGHKFRAGVTDPWDANTIPAIRRIR